MHIVAAAFISTCGWLLVFCFSVVFQPFWIVAMLVWSPFIISAGVLAVYAVEAVVWSVRHWSHSWSHRQRRSS